MKHVRMISATPQKAETTAGGVIAALGQVVSIIAAFITQKEDSNRIIDG